MCTYKIKIHKGAVYFKQKAPRWGLALPVWVCSVSQSGEGASPWKVPLSWRIKAADLSLQSGALTSLVGSMSCAARWCLSSSSGSAVPSSHAVGSGYSRPSELPASQAICSMYVFILPKCFVSLWTQRCAGKYEAFLIEQCSQRFLYVQLKFCCSFCHPACLSWQEFLLKTYS